MQTRFNIDVNLSYWLNNDGLLVYREDAVGFGDNIACLNLLSLVKQEVSIYAVPNSGNLEEINKVYDNDGCIQELRDKMNDIVLYLDKVLDKAV